MSSIGARLREERVRLGHSQTVFGAVGGVLKQAQLKYEKGERYPDAAYLEAASRIGADIQYIVIGIRSDSVLAPDESVLLARYRVAPQSSKSAAQAALSASFAPAT